MALTHNPTMRDIFMDGYPKEFGLYREYVASADTLLRRVNESNGKTGVYVSIFRYALWNGEDPVRNTAIIPAIYLDFDEGEQSAEDIFKLHNWCEENDYRHFVLFTGRGYHFYIFILQNYNNPAVMLRSFVNWIQTTLDLMIDRSSINLAKMSRFPNTYNPKRRAYCIPLTHEQIHWDDYDKHFELAQKQQFINPVIGTVLFDASRFEITIYEAPLELIDEDYDPETAEFNQALSLGVLSWDDLAPCIKRMLTSEDLNYDKRSLVARFFKEFGYTHEEVQEVFSHTLNKKRYHNAYGVAQKHLKYIWQKNYPPLECKEVKMITSCPNCVRKQPSEFIIDEEEISTEFDEWDFDLD